MLDPQLTSTQKCLAYIVADCLNCVTWDSWPAQQTLSRMLGHKSIKTVQRAARALAKRQVITLKRNKSGKGGLRYSPVFWPEDMDKPVRNTGHLKTETTDTSDQESLLGIHIESSSTEAATEQKPAFNPKQRGAIEIKLGEMLGPDGLQVLSRLAAIDDAIVDRLCRTYAAGTLGKRELAAARLAAEQAGREIDF